MGIGVDLIFLPEAKHTGPVDAMCVCVSFWYERRLDARRCYFWVNDNIRIMTI